MHEFDLKRPKESQSDALLSLDSTSTTEIPVDQVPGGTISFIFERLSATIEQENDGESGDGDLS